MIANLDKTTYKKPPNHYLSLLTMISISLGPNLDELGLYVENRNNYYGLETCEVITIRGEMRK